MDNYESWSLSRDLDAKIKDLDRKMRRNMRARMKLEGEAKTEMLSARITPTVHAMVEMLTIHESKTELLTRLIEYEYYRRFPKRKSEQSTGSENAQTPPILDPATGARDEHLGENADEVER